MGRDNISNNMYKKFSKFFAKTLDTDNDGVVSWPNFEEAVDSIISKEEAETNSRLKILRKRLEQNFQKYFWGLCAVGDANQDGNIDLNEWLDVINDIIDGLNDKNEFPEWYEGLHKALWRSYEFMDDRSVSKSEFSDMLIIWDIDEEAANKAFDFITENGKHKMDYNQFSTMMKKFFLIDEPGHPLNLGLDAN